MLCPRCDGQGSIYLAEIVDLKIDLFICDECEACWIKKEDIGTRNFTDLPTFLEKYGIVYGRKALEVKNYLDSDKKPW